MANIRFNHLADYTLAELLPVFQAAFADYPVPLTLNLAEFTAMVTRRGYDLGISVGAFDGEHCVGFHLICRGQWQGAPCAYDTGSGVLPAYRHQGIGRRMFQWLAPRLREAGIRQCRLEVLADNTPARRSYAAVGFRPTRQFDCLSLDLPAADADAPFDAWQIEIRNDLPAEFAQWLEDEPAWQNSFDAMARTPQRLTRVMLVQDGRVLAAGLVNADAGDVPLFAVAPSHRRQGLGRALLRVLRRASKVPLRFINLTAGGPSVALVKALGGVSLSGQWEMCWLL
jgi:ribosomal protein S18 acetylase RimI-like enzyme